MMLDRQFDKDPRFYCFGCHREGTMSERGNGEKIRICDVCGLKFCHYCGHVDESSLSFLCNSCWKERANRLVRGQQFDEAIAILEMLQDYDGINDVIAERDIHNKEKLPKKIRFERSIIFEDGVHRLSTTMNGRVFVDRSVRKMGKKGLMEKIGWKEAPLVWKIFENFSERSHLLGSFEIDSRTGKVLEGAPRDIHFQRRYYLFHRVCIQTSRGTEMATHIDGKMIIDGELNNIPKKELINRYGWDMVMVIIGIAKASIAEDGHYIFDKANRTIHRIISMKKV